MVSVAQQLGRRGYAQTALLEIVNDIWTDTHGQLKSQFTFI